MWIKRSISSIERQSNRWDVFSLFVGLIVLEAGKRMLSGCRRPNSVALVAQKPGAASGNPALKICRPTWLENEITWISSGSDLGKCPEVVQVRYLNQFRKFPELVQEVSWTSSGTGSGSGNLPEGSSDAIGDELVQVICLNFQVNYLNFFKSVIIT